MHTVPRPVDCSLKISPSLLANAPAPTGEMVPAVKMENPDSPFAGDLRRFVKDSQQQKSEMSGCSDEEDLTFSEEFTTSCAPATIFLTGNSQTLPHCPEQ